jgi:hypothetical protein
MIRVHAKSVNDPLEKIFSVRENGSLLDPLTHAGLKPQRYQVAPAEAGFRGLRDAVVCDYDAYIFDKSRSRDAEGKR